MLSITIHKKWGVSNTTEKNLVLLFNLYKKEFPTLKKKSLIFKFINISFDDYKRKTFAKLLGFGEKALTYL